MPERDAYLATNPIISPFTNKPFGATPTPDTSGGGGGTTGGGTGGGGATLKPMSPDVINDARSAIQSGRPAAAVIQRLKENGFDPSGL